jgi:hypothetical protein
MYTLEQSDLTRCLDFAKTCEHTIDQVENIIDIKESFNMLQTFVSAYNDTCSRGAVTNEQTERATTMFVEDAKNYPTKTIMYKDVPEYLHNLYEYSGKVDKYVESVCSEYPDRAEQIQFIGDSYMESFMDHAINATESVKPKPVERFQRDSYFIF